MFCIFALATKLKIFTLDFRSSGDIKYLEGNAQLPCVLNEHGQ